MPEEFTREGDREIAGSSKKIFHIPKGFGEISTTWVPNRDIEAERQFIQIFKSHGYQVVISGDFNENNPQEFGIGEEANISQRVRDKRIADRVGIKMPDTASPTQVIKSPTKFVAKLPDVQRGEEKFLLETEEQKLTFVTWALLGNNIVEFYQLRPPALINAKRLIEKVKAGDYNDKLFDQKNLGRWVFEEFIDTPGDYNTSLRVVVDGFGKIHYSQVARSENPKGQTISIKSALPTTEVDMWGKPASIFLTNPNSPFYIAPRAFVSNVSRGGTPILLNQKIIGNSINRKILESLGIDPNKPKLPQNLVGTSREIGKASRRYYPFVGIDFLQNTKGDYIMLEINTGPHLRPEALGLPPDTDDITCDTKLLQRIFKA